MSSTFLVIPLAQFQWQTVKGKLFCLELCFDEICFDKLAFVWFRGFCWLSTWVAEMRLVLDGVDSRQGSTVVEFELISEECFCSFLSVCLSVLPFVSAIKKNSSLVPWFDSSYS